MYISSSLINVHAIYNAYIEDIQALHMWKEALQ